MNPLITVLTPTYNRESELKKLFQSLVQQSNQEFIWLVVDDGSTDDTEKLVRNYTDHAPFKVIYIQQKNRGKHVALNKGISLINTKYTFIVDSDDILTENAIETFYSDLGFFDKENTICGVGYLRGYSATEVIGKEYPNDHMIDDFITVRINQGVTGDKAEIWKTADLRTVPFPEIEGERFFGEGYAWFKLAFSKKMLFVNRIIYITEYLDGGLSKSGRALRIRCPLGGVINAEIMMHKPFNLKNRVKGAMLYVAYGRFANRSWVEMMSGTNEQALVMLAYIPGTILYYRWKRYL